MHAYSFSDLRRLVVDQTVHQKLVHRLQRQTVEADAGRICQTYVKRNVGDVCVGCIRRNHIQERLQPRRGVDVTQVCASAQVLARRAVAALSHLTRIRAFHGDP